MPSSPPAKKPAATKAPESKTPAADAARKVKGKAPATGKTGGKGENLLTVGFKVFGQSNRMVESLLGMPKGASTGKRPAHKTPLDQLGDTLGFRKLEDVFDQRIAAALERLGIPSADELANLREQVRQLIEERDKALTQAQSRRKS